MNQNKIIFSRAQFLKSSQHVDNIVTIARYSQSTSASLYLMPYAWITCLWYQMGFAYCQGFIMILCTLSQTSRRYRFPLWSPLPADVLNAVNDTVDYSDSCFEFLLIYSWVWTEVSFIPESLSCYSAFDVIDLRIEEAV